MRTKPISEMTEAEYQRWLKKNKITGAAAAAADRKRRLGKSKLCNQIKY